MATAVEPEVKTYWCHECDMSVSLTLLPSPLLCLHCHTSFLELMTSPFSQNNVESPLFGVVFHDALLLLSPKPLLAKPCPLPSVNVTPSLLSALNPNGVVFCTVCKDQISLFDTEAKQLPCKHLYHAGCITPCFDLHASCPLCRLRLEEEAAQEEEDEGDGVVRRSGGSLKVPKRLCYKYTPTGSDWKIDYGFLFGIMVTAVIVLEELAYLKRSEMRSLPPNFQIDLVGGATFPRGM